MENKGHSAKMRLWLCHITLEYIHAKFEDLQNASAVISKPSFKKRGSYIKTISHLGQN